MAQEQLFRKILYPIDFSDASVKALHYVVKLSEVSCADLILLHTYRLFGADATNHNLAEAKHMLENNAQMAFEKIEEEMLKHSSVQCSFHSEVGFISDRIISSIEPLNIDLIILCTNIHQQIMGKSDNEYNGLVSKVKCPIMLMPSLSFN
ncbi:universal stress protein [Fulvivirga sp. RKSG066]|uniref:universal stress protein n=1 Tax=Fulvivirga aurantia TaxID=2529383 RepID=UPI0012BD57B1|nr:universal stress protein [Fulvivirga aurantia]MTI21771.1 universal stress protein [Fulvivirga aurantia]